MGLFDFLRKAPSTSAMPDTEWIGVAADLAGTLWQLLKAHPEMLANPYARVVLKNDWSVSIASGECDPRNILGPSDVSFVLLRENETAYAAWVAGLRGDAFFQKAETEQFAKSLVNLLRQTVNVVD